MAPRNILHISYGKEGVKYLALPIVFVSLTLLPSFFAVIIYTIDIVLLLNKALSFPVEKLDELGFMLVLFLISFFGSVTYVNNFSEVLVTEIGLKVRIYCLFFFWKTIRWEGIIDIIETNHLDTRGVPLIFLKLRKLSIWHRIISMKHALGKDPVLSIPIDLRNSEELLRIVREHLNNKR